MQPIGVVVGLLTRDEPVAIDPALEKTVIAEEQRERRETLKLLAKNQLAIQATLESGEEVAAIVGHWKMTGYILVITRRRLLNFKKGRLDQSLQQSDIGRTRLGNLPNGHFMASIETHDGMMYRDDDMRHFEPARYLSVEVDDPKVARGICAIVDAINGLTN